MIRRLPGVATVLAALLWTLPGSLLPTASAGFSSAHQVAFPRSHLTVASRSGAQHEFTVELARTSAQRSRGLMYRTRLDPDQGMLFLYPAPQVARMWMKNTSLTLDMLFIAADGRITNIAERTEPLSTRTIISNQPVAAVLELAGGRCAELGIAPGDQLLHPAFATHSGGVQP